MTMPELISVLLGALLLGLVAIWYELRVSNRKHRARANTDHVILPMSTGVSVLPTQSAQITGRPQEAFKPDRLFLSSAGTAGGAADWVVNDIKIAGKSIFLQSGDVPGDLFSTDAVDTFVSFHQASPGQDVQLVVTYIGTNKEGCPFFASMVGPSVKVKLPRKQRQAKKLIEAAATV